MDLPLKNWPGIWTGWPNRPDDESKQKRITGTVCDWDHVKSCDEHLIGKSRIIQHFIYLKLQTISTCTWPVIIRLDPYHLTPIPVMGSEHQIGWQDRYSTISTASYRWAVWVQWPILDFHHDYTCFLLCHMGKDWDNKGWVLQSFPM